MPNCEQITTRRTWCTRRALHGSKYCRWHQDGPAFAATGDDYRIADAKRDEREKEIAD
jgi:hypothetical protein